MIQHDAKQKGVTIYLAMLMMSSALATALFVSTVFVREFQIVRDVSNSARALYVADSAMEYTLYQVRVADDYSSFAGAGTNFSLSTGTCASSIVPTVVSAVCSVAIDTAISPGSVPGCPAVIGCNATDCMRVGTKGAYGATNRAFEIVFPNC